MILRELRSSAVLTSCSSERICARQDPLAVFADHEFVVQQGACGCGARRITANPLPCAIAVTHEPLERSALSLSCSR